MYVCIPPDITRSKNTYKKPYIFIYDLLLYANINIYFKLLASGYVHVRLCVHFFCLGDSVHNRRATRHIFPARWCKHGTLSQKLSSFDECTSTTVVTANADVSRSTRSNSFTFYLFCIGVTNAQLDLIDVVLC